MFEIEYEFREKDLIHFNELRLKNDLELQKTLRRSRLFVPSVLLFIGLFFYVYYGDINTALYIVLLTIVWTIASPYFTRTDMRRQIINRYTEAEKKGMFGIHRLKIEPEYLFEISPGGKHRTRWADMLRVERLKDYVHIYTALDAAIVIPVETLKMGDLKAFTKQAESMIERLN